MRRALVVAVSVAMTVAAACSSQSAAPASSKSPPAAAQVQPGGCAGTVVTTGVSPPPWALAGFSGAPTSLPWALSRSGNAVAYLFAKQLVAGHTRRDGTTNKVLWELKDNAIPRVTAHPQGAGKPVVEIGGAGAGLNQLPSIADLPAAGCWTFDIAWAHGKSDQLSLEVLPEP